MRWRATRTAIRAPTTRLRSNRGYTLAIDRSVLARSLAQALGSLRPSAAGQETVDRVGDVVKCLVIDCVAERQHDAARHHLVGDRQATRRLADVDPAEH